jgi:hypothetical protein
MFPSPSTTAYLLPYTLNFFHHKTAQDLVFASYPLDFNDDMTDEKSVGEESWPDAICRRSVR